MNRARKGLSILAVLVLVTLLSAGASADVGIQKGTGTIEPNIGIDTGTVIGFAGQEWWVIGYNDGTKGSGIYSTPSNSATLFLKSTGMPYGESAFDSTSRYTSDYNGSTLQAAMNAIASDIFLREEREAASIIPRTLTAGDDITYPITGGNVDNQKLWPISHDEWTDIRAIHKKATTLSQERGIQKAWR